MSNFSGNVRKSERSFKPQATSGSDAGVGKVVAGVYAGQDAPVVFEKASPVLDTAPTPRTDLRGESEIGLSGLVDHPNNDGQAIYAAAQIAREYRHITAPTGGIENLSVEQRRRMRDELVRRVGATADGAQQPEGDSTSAQATRAYVREVASLLFGLIDELSETPDFLRPKSVSDFMHKSASSHVEIHCPHCRSANYVELNGVGGLQKFTCTSCAKGWQQDISISAFTKSSANPELADLKKQLHDLTERIRTLIANRAGVDPLAGRRSGQDHGDRFITKGNDPKQLMKQALDNGLPVQFSGQDPRDAAAKTGGRRFQHRSE